MPRLASLLAATAIASGAGLIGLAAGGMASADRELRAASPPAGQHVCPRPRPQTFDSREL
jgi:hypothetical protein